MPQSWWCQTSYVKASTTGYFAERKKNLKPQRPQRRAANSAEENKGFTAKDTKEHDGRKGGNHKGQREHREVHK